MRNMTGSPSTAGWALTALVVLLTIAAFTEVWAWQDCLADHGFWFCLRVL